jgi:uncharacterized protein (DUF433 family)
MSTPPASADVVHPYVERRPTVQGGRPVIRGSRFPVSSIVQNHRRGLSVDEILHEFPQLGPAEVYDAAELPADHPSHDPWRRLDSTSMRTSIRSSPTPSDFAAGRP